VQIKNQIKLSFLVVVLLHIFSVVDLAEQWVSFFELVFGHVWRPDEI
jgi:hypothetical protein